MRLKSLLLTGALGLASLLGLGTCPARANSVELTFQGIGANGTNWDFKYTAVLTGGNYLQTGDTVSFFDIGGTNLAGSFVPAIGSLSNYSFSSGTASDAAVQPTVPKDTDPAGAGGIGESGPTYGDLSLPDFVFSYNGTSPLVNPTGSLDLLLGTFVITSSVRTGAVDATLTFDTALGANGFIGGGDDKFNSVTGTTVVPRANGFEIPTPLPASATGGLVLFGLLTARRVKRNK